MSVQSSLKVLLTLVVFGSQASKKCLKKSFGSWAAAVGDISLSGHCRCLCLMMQRLENDVLGKTICSEKQCRIADADENSR